VGVGRQKGEGYRAGEKVAAQNSAEGQIQRMSACLDDQAGSAGRHGGRRRSSASVLRVRPGRGTAGSAVGRGALPCVQRREKGGPAGSRWCAGAWLQAALNQVIVNQPVAGRWREGLLAGRVVVGPRVTFVCSCSCPVLVCVCKCERAWKVSVLRQGVAVSANRGRALVVAACRGSRRAAALLIAPSRTGWRPRA